MTRLLWWIIDALGYVCLAVLWVLYAVALTVILVVLGFFDRKRTIKLWKW